MRYIENAEQVVDARQRIRYQSGQGPLLVNHVEFDGRLAGETRALHEEKTVFLDPSLPGDIIPRYLDLDALEPEMSPT